MLFNSLRLRIVGVAVATLAPCLLLVGIGLWKNYNNIRRPPPNGFDSMPICWQPASTTASPRSTRCWPVSRGRCRCRPSTGTRNDKLLRQVILELPPYIGNVKVFGVDGRSIGSSAGLPRKDLDARDRSYFRRILAGDDQAVGEPVQARTDGRWIVNVARPINDTSGRLQAVIAAGLLLDRLDDALGLDQLPPDSAVEIINEDGIVVSGRGQIGAQVGIKRLVPVQPACRAKWCSR